MRQTRSSLLCVILAVLLLAALTPGITIAQVKKLTTDELATRAEVVAVGKVSALKSEWNEDRTRIRTAVTVTVDEYVKGERQTRSLTLYTPGGEVDGIGEIYSHTAKFAMDEEVVVFAEKDTKGRFRVSGGPQGKYTVKRDETQGAAMVTDIQTLDQLKTLVRSALK